MNGYPSTGAIESGKLVRRKPVEALSASEVELSVRDAGIRQCIRGALERAGLRIKKTQGTKGRPGYDFVNTNGKKVTSVAVKDALRDTRMPSGVPVRRVRLIVNDATAVERRQGEPGERVIPGNTHHVLIIRWTHKGKQKRALQTVTMREAAERASRGQQIIARHPGAGYPADAEVCMTLCMGEAVLATRAGKFKSGNGSPRILIFRGSHSTQGKLHFVDHADARPSSSKGSVPKRKVWTTTANTLEAVKVLVDPLGRVRREAARDPQPGAEIDPIIEALATERVADPKKNSLSAARRKLAAAGLAGRGADLTAAIHRARQRAAAADA